MTVPTVQMGQLRPRGWRTRLRLDLRPPACHHGVPIRGERGGVRVRGAARALPLPPSTLPSQRGREEAAAPRPGPSQAASRAGVAGKAPTQDPAPNLPETCKHETVGDERRLESHRFKIKGGRVVKAPAKRTRAQKRKKTHYDQNAAKLQKRGLDEGRERGLPGVHTGASEAGAGEGGTPA